MNTNTQKAELSELHYVYAASVGGVNPNALLSDDARDAQVARLNRCLNDYPKGIIIGKDITIGRYQLGEHELSMQRTTYHIGFTRKPAWMEEKEQKKG